MKMILNLPLNLVRDFLSEITLSHFKLEFIQPQAKLILKKLFHLPDKAFKPSSHSSFAAQLADVSRTHSRNSHKPRAKTHMLTFTWPNVTTRKSDGLIQTYSVHTRVHSCTCSFKLKTNCEHETKHVRDILTLMTVGTFCKRH